MVSPLPWLGINRIPGIPDFLNRSIDVVYLKTQMIKPDQGIRPRMFFDTAVEKLYKHSDIQSRVHR